MNWMNGDSKDPDFQFDLTGINSNGCQSRIVSLSIERQFINGNPLIPEYIRWERISMITMIVAKRVHASQ